MHAQLQLYMCYLCGFNMKFFLHVLMVLVFCFLVILEFMTLHVYYYHFYIVMHIVILIMSMYVVVCILGLSEEGLYMSGNLLVQRIG